MQGPRLDGPPSVLVTGASSGIGYASALDLDRTGWRVFAGVRTGDDERRLRDELSKRSTPLRLDVTNRGDIERAVRAVDAAAGGRLDALVNNAGIVYHGPIEVLTDDAVRHQFDVNVFGLLAVTRAFLPLVRAARGRIAIVGSISGRTTFGYNGIYAASKFALTGVADALRIEVRPFGVRLSVIEPGVFKTAIWKKTTPAALRDDTMLEPHVALHYRRIFAIVDDAMARIDRHAPECTPVVAAVRHAVGSAHPKLRYVVGTDAAVQLAVERFVPMRWRVELLAVMTRLFVRSGR